MNESNRNLYCAVKRIDMSHGAGGRATAALIRNLFARYFFNPFLDQGDDGAFLPRPEGHIVMSTDSHVVSPLFFPGGDIGALSVHGTVNDISVCGAVPLYLSAGFIIEEGFPLSDLEKIVRSMAEAAEEAGISIVTGDTKVVEKGKADGLYINTTGIGSVPDGIRLSGSFCREGDAVAVSGFIGEHGVAVMSSRQNLEFETAVKSDSANLNTLTAELVKHVPSLRCMRDATRGGLATTLNELAEQSGVGFEINESEIPVSDEVYAACEFLGLDPFYVANEGKLIAVCAEKDAAIMLQVMHRSPLGKNARLIGHCTKDENHFVKLATLYGGSRLIDRLNGDQLPRIC